MLFTFGESFSPDGLVFSAILRCVDVVVVIAVVNYLDCLQKSNGGSTCDVECTTDHVVAAQVML